MKRIKQVGKIINWILIIFLTFLVVCELFLVGSRLITGNKFPTIFGYSNAVVISGSMDPKIKVNDMVIIQDKENYRIGDIISYKSNASLVTHRIIDQTNDGFITKGDANNTQDIAPVKEENILGKVVLIIPKIGMISEFLRTPIGMMLLVVAGFGLIEIQYLLGRNQKEA